MTAQLNEEEYLKGLCVEAHRLVYGESASVRMAVRATKRNLESELGHVGPAGNKHASWSAGRPEYATIDVLLETENAGGEVRGHTSSQ